MGKSINLEKINILEVEAYGMVLTLSLEEDNERILAQIESSEGGKTIHISAHEVLPNTIYFSIDKKKGLHLVK